MQKPTNSGSLYEMAASQNVSANIKHPYPFQIYATTSMVCRRNLAMLTCACLVAAPWTDSSRQTGHSEHWQLPQLLQ